MELHQLRYFLAVAETGNFTRAANQCFVSQPSLSQQIQKLEDELGQPLFDRLGRRAELTTAGQAFLDRARRILLAVEDATRAVKDAGDEGGRLRIGVIPSVAPYLLPELLPLVTERLPKLTLQVYEDFGTYLFEEIENGKLDVAVLARSVEGRPHLEVEPLLSEPLLVTMPKAHPLAAVAKLSAADLSGQRLVLLGDASSLAHQTQRFFGDNNINVEISCRCAQVKTVKALVAAGLGLAILPKMAAGRDNVPGLVYREVSDPSPTREIAMVRHRLRFQPRAETQFVALLREHCQTRGEQSKPTPP